MSGPRQVLVIGGGAREHALAWRLSADPDPPLVDVAPGSEAMAEVATTWPQVAATDTDAITGLIDRRRPDLVVVGPEAPLADGLADRLTDAGVPVFGPSRAAARLESSKAFCRQVAQAAGIPMAEGSAFDDVASAIAFARQLGPPVVVKADGLAGGKGVTVCPTLVDAERAIRSAIELGAHGSAGRRVVVERALEGVELSVIALCDGRTAVALPTARDHKRLADGDRGPNTGGMGAVSPAPSVTADEVEALVAEFHRPALQEMERRGTPFRGALYAGLMLTADGPYLLEFNVRFGDPEAQAILPRLPGSFATHLWSAAEGHLVRSVSSPRQLVDEAASSEAAVAVVLAAPGYPGTPATGTPIVGLEEARARGALVFHGATTRSTEDDPHQTGYRTAGGRVVTIVGRGPSIAAARASAYAAVDAVRFAGRHFRSDIGSAGPETPAWSAGATGSEPRVEATVQ